MHEQLQMIERLYQSKQEDEYEDDDGDDNDNKYI